MRRFRHVKESRPNSRVRDGMRQISNLFFAGCWLRPSEFLCVVFGTLKKSLANSRVAPFYEPCRPKPLHAFLEDPFKLSDTSQLVHSTTLNCPPDFSTGFHGSPWPFTVHSNTPRPSAALHGPPSPWTLDSPPQFCTVLRIGRIDMRANLLLWCQWWSAHHVNGRQNVFSTRAQNAACNNDPPNIE